MARRAGGLKESEFITALIVQSVAIVISILLALWVDQWKQQRADHDLARASLSNFLKEIQRNESLIDNDLPFHNGVRVLLGSLSASHSIHTQAEFQSEVGVDALRPPSLLNTAWQTAVATGAVTHLDYETVSALSLTYTLQDRFREDSRTGIQSVMQASNFGPGGADLAIHSADNYMREVVTSEEDLRAAYVEAERVVRASMARIDGKGSPRSGTPTAAHDSTGVPARDSTGPGSS